MAGYFTSFVFGSSIFSFMLGFSVATMVCRQSCQEENIDLSEFWKPGNADYSSTTWGKPQMHKIQPEEYQSIGDLINHTKNENFKFSIGGKPKSPSKPKPVPTGKCNILFSGLNEKEKNEIVDIHNKLRLKVANGNQPDQPPASNMHELHWNEELAQLAQKLSDTCEYKHDQPLSKKYGHLGQNIAWAASSMPEKSPIFKGMIDDWYKEVAKFKGKKIHPFVPHMTYGHYTQVVWAKTESVGCGFTAYRDAKYPFNKLLVCNYGPTGNIRGGSLYKIGNSCSSCAKSCSKSNLGLCNVGS